MEFVQVHNEVSSTLGSKVMFGVHRDVQMAALDTEVLFKSLVDTLCLTIAFRVVSGGEVQLHVESSTQRSKES